MTLQNVNFPLKTRNKRNARICCLLHFRGANPSGCCFAFRVHKLTVIFICISWLQALTRSLMEPTAHPVPFVMNKWTYILFGEFLPNRRRKRKISFNFVVFAKTVLTLTVVLELRGNVFGPRVLFESVEDLEFFLVVHDITDFVIVCTQQSCTYYYTCIAVKYYCTEMMRFFPKQNKNKTQATRVS